MCKIEHLRDFRYSLPPRIIIVTAAVNYTEPIIGREKEIAILENKLLSQSAKFIVQNLGENPGLEVHPFKNIILR